MGRVFRSASKVAAFMRECRLLGMAAYDQIIYPITALFRKSDDKPGNEAT